MTRSAMLRSQGGSKAGAASPGREPSAGKTAARDLPPDATLPATPAQMLALSVSPPQAAAPKPAAASPASPPPASPPPASPPPANPAPASPAPDASTPSAQETLDLVLRELRFLREQQERILLLLERSPAAGRLSSTEPEEDEAQVSPIRARRRKSVVLIDDDPATREAAVAEMMQADVPVRAFDDGNAAVSAIAEEKPDVIVLELGLAGAMEGRDVINMIKATMEWVEIPIVLWTREPVANQKEARQIHGADEIVPKASGASALVARVITLFRRVH